MCGCSQPTFGGLIKSSQEKNVPLIQLSGALSTSDRTSETFITPKSSGDATAVQGEFCNYVHRMSDIRF